MTGTLPGRAFTTGAPVALSGDSGDALVVAPLLDGIERLGVLELTVDDADEPAVAACRRFADLVTQFVHEGPLHRRVPRRPTAASR